MQGTSLTRASIGQRVGAAVVALVVALLCTSRALALDPPPFERRVTDSAALLSADTREQLEQRLAEYEAKTGHQFAILTIPSLEGDAIEEFGIRAAERWKLGSKTRDDGLLLVIAKNDRRVRVEVGRGLEGAVTDAFSSRVIRNIMTPAFRAGDYEGGIAKGVDALMKQASGEAVDPAAGGPEAGARRRAPERGLPVGLFLAFFLLPAAMALFSRRGGRRGRGGFFVGGFPMGWGGGSGRGFGGRGGGGFGGGGFGGGGGGSFGGGGSSGSW